MTAPYFRRVSSLTALSLAVGICVIQPAHAGTIIGATGFKHAKACETAQAASESARKRREEGKGKAAAQAQKYPNATRKAPEPKVSAKEAKALNDLQADAQAQKYADVISKGEALGAATTGNAYVRAYAYLQAAYAAHSSGDEARSIENFKKAVEADGLDNNNHFDAMYNLAIIGSQNGHAEEAVTTVDRFIAETKTTDTRPLELKAQTLALLKRYADSAAVYEQMMALKPGDSTLMFKAADMYQRADKNDRANALLEAGRKQGQLDANAYLTLFVGYANAEKYQQAEDVLLEGVNNGTLKPSPQLASNFSVLAWNAYNTEKVAKAIDFYKRAASMSSNGEASLNLARILLNENRLAEAKAAAREALAKGVKKPKDAEAILARPGGK